MPDVSRAGIRMDCTGVDLVHPLDRMPPGAFGYLFNVRVVTEGRIDGRPGYTRYIDALPDIPNSIRRLNDPQHLSVAAGYALVGGVGVALYAGSQATYREVDSGYSGDPLSLIPFRPENSDVAWMYVYDKNKQSKIRPDNLLNGIGLAPPTRAPEIEYAVPADVDIVDGQHVAGWTATGVSTAPTATNRYLAATTIGSILYNAGNTGWACINPSSTNLSWAGERMKVILAGGTPEVITIREIHPAIPFTRVAGIHYDSGTTGLCSIVFEESPAGLARNSLINIDGEVVRVLEVIPAPTGTNYSIRCSTIGTNVVGDGVTGLVSWYAYTIATHAAAENMIADYIKLTHASAGVGAAKLTAAIDASIANGRQIDPANDYLHISIFLDNPQNVVNVQVMLALDNTPNFSFTNPGNCYIWTFDQTALHLQGASDSSWAEVVVPISEATRFGVDLSKTLANISGVSIQMTSTGTSDYGFDWMYLFGTYGQVIQPNSSVGVVYQTRFRSSVTGAHSVPGPQNRYQLFPLREGVIITPQGGTAAGIDSLDIYRQGGSVTQSLYVGSVNNSLSPLNTYTDGLTDQAVLAVNQPPDLTALQPWPILASGQRGVVTVIGTHVLLTSGDRFNTAMLSNTVIFINGVAFLTYGPPSDGFNLELTQDAGSITDAAYQIPSPTLAGQNLPYAFGPLEGPFAPVVFALGDGNGKLYYSNVGDLDSAADTNFLELANPSSDLISGACWNGLVFCGNRDVVFAARYSFLNTSGSPTGITFQWVDLSAAPAGPWSRWASCHTPVGWAYLGRDGLYIATDGGAVNITDERLYPLFPHEGQAASQINSGTNIILPVDMSLLSYLRLSYCDETIRFSYRDTGGNFNTLIYEIYKKRWFLNNYHDNITYHYLVEGGLGGPQTEDILMLAITPNNSIKLAGGDKDDVADINSLMLSPSLDEKDERGQKLYVDTMTMADGVGTLVMAATYENAQTFSPVSNFTCDGTIKQFLQNIASLSDLTLHRNVGVKFAWTGGPSGPRVYAWEVAGYPQPYLSKKMVTQFIHLSFPGWKHFRRMFPALISNSPVRFTIKTQDGRTFIYTIPSTGGQFRILPQMLDSGIKDLAFAFELDGLGETFAPFLQEFVIETKEWTESTYIQLAVFRS